jgi:hypothetical protein
MMKIYRFNPDTGAYLGEDFADEAPLKRGDHIIPDDATMIPPPQVERGQMPFFNIRDQHWEIRTIPSLLKSPSRDKLDENTPSQESL